MSTPGLHIGQFNDSYPPVIDGVALVARNYAYWLDKKYGKSTMVCFKVPGYVDDDPFDLLRFPSFTLPAMKPYRVGVPFLSPSFCRRLKDIPFDIVHSHCPFVSGHLALNIAKKRNIPIVSTFHSKYREDFKKVLKMDSLVEPALRKVVAYYEAVDYVWVPSEKTKEVLEEYGYTGNIEVMENGTDMAVPALEEYTAYRNRGKEFAGLENDDPVFLYIGQQRWGKNLALVLDSLAILKRSGKNVNMLFVGTGPDLPEMKKYVSSLGMEDRVRFLGVVRDREIIKALYALAYLFMFPSLYDTASLVMREAAAFSLPCVFIRGATTAEGIEDGVNGILSENDPEGFSAVLAHCLENPGLVETAGRGAMKTLYRSWETVADEVILRYRDILKDRAGKG